MANNNSLAITVSMESLKALAKALQSDVSICIRGRHAVGKSEGVYQVAADLRHDAYKDPEFCARVTKALEKERSVVKILQRAKSKVWKYEFGLPVVERRLSQMTEGDMIGLPFMDVRPSGEHATAYKPVDWLVNASDFPVVLFLDERNRALEQVKQAVFQIADSKAYYSLLLHEGTRVIVAENVGDEYTVQQQDPAEISRTATVELDPTPAEWIKYAESIGVDQSLIEFIRQNEQFLEHKGVFEPMKKYPDRRAWVRMDQQLREGNFYEHPENHLFYVIATSMVGVEAGIKFTNFCKTRDRQVSAEEILRDWDKAKKKLGNATVNRLGECGQKVVSYLTKPDSKTKKDREISDDEIVQLSLFLKDLPGELFMTYYMPIVNRRDLVLKLQPLCKEHLLTVTRPGKKVTESK
jgi:hypothetical protein